MVDLSKVEKTKPDHYCSNPDHELRFAESTEDGQLFCTVCKAPFKIQSRSVA